MRCLMAVVLSFGMLSLGCYTPRLPKPAVPDQSEKRVDPALTKALRSIALLEGELVRGAAKYGMRGSAVLIGPRIAVTARHCVINCVNITLSYNGRKANVIDKRFSLAQDADFAVVSLDAELSSAEPAALVPANDLPVAYERCFALGHALGIETVTVTEGLIQPREGDLIRFSSPIIYGNSGGGVFCVRKGQLALVAVSVAGYTAGGGIVPHMALGYEIHKGLELVGEER